MVQGVIIQSAYVPQRGLDDSQKVHFCDCFISFVRNLGKEEIVVVARDINGHVRSAAEGFEDSTEVMIMDIGI